MELLEFVIGIVSGGGLLALLNWYTSNKKADAETDVMVRGAEVERLECALDTLLDQYRQISEQYDIEQQRSDARIKAYNSRIECLEGRVILLEKERDEIRRESQRKEAKLELQLSGAYERITALESEVAKLTELLEIAKRTEERQQNEIGKQRREIEKLQREVKDTHCGM